MTPRSSSPALSSPIPEEDLEREYPNEWTLVERPLLRQLAAMGWDFLAGDLDYPQKTGRVSFRETILRDRLRAAIRRINRDAYDQEWLDPVTIERAIRELLRPEAGRGLLEWNRVLTERLLAGVLVEVAPAEGDRAERPREARVQFIAWETERGADNDFLAVNQFKVLIRGTSHAKIPDLVLFVNGLPLVVVECKSPAVTEPMNAAVEQLLHYSDQRDLDGGEREGIPELFEFNQLLVATHFYEARASVLGDDGTHFAEWKDTSPVPSAEVRHEVGKPADARLESQETLIAGMLRPAHLLDLVRNFTLFDSEEGSLVKKVARYQQFRAVHAALTRLQTGRTRRQTEDRDERGGVIWHTQGSGKSLTMVFLVRKLRTVEALRPFKVVVVTDRVSLERQLRQTATLTGQPIRPTDREAKQGLSGIEIVRRILHEDGPDLVFAMMQKQQDPDAETQTLTYEVPAYERLTEDGDGKERTDAPIALERSGTRETTRTLRQTLRATAKVEVVNPSESILLLVDECHRTQAGDFHAYMMGALPNAVKIGFTGTPILGAGERNTLGIFGGFLDTYSMRDSWRDGATVEILYEGRSADGLVDDTARLDQAFDNRFHAYTDEERAEIRARYGNEPDILEAPRLIAAKARDLLLHYAGDVLPNGFKAQVVAVSRKAAVRYQEAIVAARDALLAEVDALPAATLALDPDALSEEPAWTQFLVRVHRHRARLAALEVAAVISSRHTDPLSWKEWTEPVNREEHERRFRLPFDHDDPGKRSPLGILIVKNMLLTGFDAPLEQVLYLDRRMADHELLQAITRVNRTRKGKPRGYVVDYCGVADALADALRAIREAEEKGIGDGSDSQPGAAGSAGGSSVIPRLADALPRLQARHREVMAVFTGRGIASLLPIDPAVQLLEDTGIRAEFLNRLRGFLDSLGALLNRPESAPYKRDAQLLGFIARVAANVYRDPQIVLVGVEPKVKQLVDTYVAAQGITPMIPPTSILDVEFDEEVRRYSNARTKASAMRHALRQHLNVKLAEDPARYAKLSEKLDAILRELHDRWDEQIKAMEALLHEAVEAEAEVTVTGVDPRVHGPFFGLLREEMERAGEVFTPAASDDGANPLKRAVDLTRELVEHIQQEIRTVDFWRDLNARRQLTTWISTTLRRSRTVPRDRVESLADRFVDVAYRRHRWLVE